MLDWSALCHLALRGMAGNDMNTTSSDRTVSDLCYSDRLSFY